MTKMIHWLSIFGIATIMLTGSIVANPVAFADDDDKKAKTFEDECAKKLDKKELNLDGLLCQAIFTLQEQLASFTLVQTNPDEPILSLQVDPNSNAPALIIEDDNNTPLFTVNGDGSIQIGSNTIIINPDGTVSGPLHLETGSTVDGLPLGSGLDGQDGLHCWDLNGNGVGDISTKAVVGGTVVVNEDVNRDRVVDVLDCVGLPGTDGAQGLPGTDGAQGLPGADGQDGAPGVPCFECVDTNSIDDFAVTSIKIADRSVSTSHIVPGSIIAQHIGNNAILLHNISPNGCTDNQILQFTGVGWICADPQAGTKGDKGDAGSQGLPGADGQDGTTLPCDRCVNAQSMSPASISSISIADESIMAIDLAAQAVGAGKIAPNAVGSLEIAADSVGRLEIAPNSISTSEIIDQSIGTADIQRNSISGALITDGSLGFVDIAQNGCTVNQIMKWNGNAWICSAESPTLSITRVVSTGSFSVNPLSSNLGSVTCPTGTQLLSGGFVAGGSISDFRLLSSSGEGNSWLVKAWNDSPSTVTAFFVTANCATFN